MALDIKPVEGMVALQLLDKEVEEKESGDMVSASSVGSPDDAYNTAIYAIVIGIGPKGPTGVKKGSTVLVRGYAANGLDIGDGVVLTDSYCIVGLVN